MSFHSFGVGRDSFLQNYLARAIQNTVEARSIAQIEPDGQLLTLQFSSPAVRRSASLPHSRSPYLLRLERVDNLGA